MVRLEQARPVEDREPSPSLMAYRELVREHAAKLYEFAVLLVEQPSLAAALLEDALRRTWEALSKDDLFVEPDEMAYRWVARGAVERLTRSSGLRGYQPSTVGDERHLNAVGVLDRFAPDQRAAVLLAVRMGTAYRFAATATGLTEGRVRDLCFAARLEYAEAERRAQHSAEVAACTDQLPRLAARADGQLADREAGVLDEHLRTCAACAAALALYEDFGAALRELPLPAPEVDPLELALSLPDSRAQATGTKRLWQHARGPALLVALLIAGVYLFRWFSPPPAQTGVGRTTDLVYARAREGDALLVLESGSGRELGTLPLGTLDPKGWRVYSASVTCNGDSCETALRLTDTATGATQAASVLPGQLDVVAGDPARQRVYLADAADDWSHLVAYDLGAGAPFGSVSAPADIQEAFNPRRGALAPGAQALFTLGRASTGGLVLLRTDLDELKVTGFQPVEGPSETGVTLAAAPDGRGAFVYFPSGPALRGLDPSGEDPPAALDLRDAAIRPGEGFVPSGGTLLAINPNGLTLYCMLPTGGIAVVQSNPLTLLRVLNADQRFRSIGGSTDGRLLYGLGFDGSYRVLDAVDGTLVASRTGVRAGDLLQVDPGE